MLLVVGSSIVWNIYRTNFLAGFWGFQNDEIAVIKVEAGEDSKTGLPESITVVSPSKSFWDIIFAVATLYVTAQGVEVVASGRRRWVDTHWFRGNSYFRIGLEWVKTALQDGWPLTSRVRFCSNRDADPAIASRKQHEKRLYRLEFKVLTFQFDPD